MAGTAVQPAAGGGGRGDGTEAILSVFRGSFFQHVDLIQNLCSRGDNSTGTVVQSKIFFF